MVKARGLRLALQMAMLAMCLAATGRAKAQDAGTFSQQDLQAKIQYCTYCHQPSGQGYVGSTPIPRLAGQQTQYFKNQLQAFIDRRRVNFFMFRVAHSLSPEMLTALADHFNALNPTTLGRRSFGTRRLWKENLRRGRSRRQDSSMLYLPRPGGQG